MTSEFDYPTKAFYETDPSADQIRHICVEAMSIISFLMSESPQHSLYSNVFSMLEQAERKLLIQGISVEMHAELSDEELMASPKVMIESVAGVIISILGSLTLDQLSTEMPELIPVSDLGGVYTVDLEAILSNPEQRHRFILGMQVDKLVSLLDMTDDERISFD